MAKLRTLSIVAFALTYAGCNWAGAEDSAIALHNELVELSCGECQFGMAGSGCNLAIRVDGNSYFVSGANIDDFGDAHAANGLCNCVRMGRATGSVSEDRFHVETLQLVNEPVDPDE